MLVEIETSSGIEFINTDHVIHLCDVNGKTCIHMIDDFEVYCEEEVVSLAERIGKGSVVRTNWQPSPSS